MEEDIIDQLYFGKIVPWEKQVEKSRTAQGISVWILSICGSYWMRMAEKFWSVSWIMVLR